MTYLLGLLCIVGILAGVVIVILAGYAEKTLQGLDPENWE